MKASVVIVMVDITVAWKQEQQWQQMVAKEVGEAWRSWAMQMLMGGMEG